MSDDPGSRAWAGGAPRAARRGGAPPTSCRRGLPRQLGLGGYSKIGWPGIVVVEGPEAGCREYVRCLQVAKGSRGVGSGRSITVR